MGRSLQEALQVVAPDWPAVLATGVGLAVTASGLWRELLWPFGLMTIALLIIVYGRIIARLVPGSPTRSAANIKTNGRYLFTKRDIPGVRYCRLASRRRARRVTALNTFWNVAASPATGSRWSFLSPDSG